LALLAFGCDAGTREKLGLALGERSPFEEPERLVGVGTELPALGRDLTFSNALSGPEVLDLRERSATLDRFVAWYVEPRVLTADGLEEPVSAACWWGEPHATLGKGPWLGRTFLAEDAAGAQKVALVSHRLWERSFGGDPSVIGRNVTLGGESFVIVGVLAPGVLLSDADVWVPVEAGSESHPREERRFQVLARLRSGVLLEQVRAELVEIGRRIESEHVAQHSEYAGWRLEARTIDEIGSELLGGGEDGSR
jgi:hypothetical protein